MKISSFRQVFGLFFVAIFHSRQKIARFHYILLNLFLKTKYTVKPLFGALFFNPCPIATFYQRRCSIKGWRSVFRLSGEKFGKINLINEKKKRLTQLTSNIYGRRRKHLP